MEITKDIQINTNNLISNSEIVISYSGKLSNSEKIFIKYGTTPNNFEYETKELDSNNEVKIQLSKTGFFYFYFSNEKNQLDNNNYKDYQLYIKQSNLVFTDNSSMKELPYRFVKLFETSNDIFCKSFYTPQTLKNTSRPQEIIIPRAFDKNSASSETKNIIGFTIEPVKPIKVFNCSQALIPTEQGYSVSMMANIKNIKTAHSLIRRIFNGMFRLFNKDSI